MQCASYPYQLRLLWHFASQMYASEVLTVHSLPFPQQNAFAYQMELEYHPIRLMSQVAATQEVAGTTQASRSLFVPFLLSLIPITHSFAICTLHTTSDAAESAGISSAARQPTVLPLKRPFLHCDWCRFCRSFRDHTSCEAYGPWLVSAL